MALISCPECGKEVSDQAPTCPNCGAPIARPVPPPPPVHAAAPVAPPPPAKKKTSKFTLGCAVVLGFILLLYIIGLIAQGPKSDRPAASSPEATEPPPTPEKTPLENVEMVDFTWNKDGFGSVMVAKFVLRNNNDFPVKDIKIKCTHYAKSGTVIDSNTRVVYDVIKAKSRKTINDFNMGFIHNQVDTSSCQVVSIEEMPPGAP
jgi:zinc ribbon protein